MTPGLNTVPRVSTATDSDAPPGLSWHGMTVGSVVLRALRRYPNRTAFVSGRGQLTYAETAELIGRIQRSLEAHGLRRGDCVGLLADSSAEIWCAGVAVQASGMTASWLHPRGSLDDHLYQLADLDARACVLPPSDIDGRGAEIAAGCGDVKVLGLGSSAVGPDLLVEAARGGTATAVDLADPRDIAIVNYTGGTTGRSKGVVRRHPAAVHSYALGPLGDFELPSDLRYLAVAPITHVAGSVVIPVLQRGGTIYLQEGFDPERFLSAVERERINMSFIVPTMLSSLLDTPSLDSTDLKSLELILYGASAISPTRLAEGLDRVGSVFSQFYGQTECYPISVLSRADHADPSVVSGCGVAVSGLEVALLDPEGQEVETGITGELCVRGAGMMEGYWRLPELTAETFAHGWLHTGDVAQCDDRGYLTIVDRIKDMIVTGGFNVFSREVEDALATHSAVAASAVFGVPDEHWGETVCAAVVMRPGETTSAEELTTHVRKLKGGVHAPKSVYIVDSLPNTAVGKIDKKVLRATYGAKSLPLGS